MLYFHTGLCWQNWDFLYTIMEDPVNCGIWYCINHQSVFFNWLQFMREPAVRKTKGKISLSLSIKNQGESNLTSQHTNKKWTARSVNPLKFFRKARLETSLDSLEAWTIDLHISIKFIFWKAMRRNLETWYYLYCLLNKWYAKFQRYKNLYEKSELRIRIRIRKYYSILYFVLYRALTIYIIVDKPK